MTEAKKKSFVLYADFEVILTRLSMKERGMLITLIYSYVNRGTVDEIDATPLVDMAFAIIRAQLDRDKEKYDEKCRKYTENAKKGGRPKKDTQTDRFFYKAKKPDNDTDTENENENDTVTDNVTDIERLAARRSFNVDDFFGAALMRTYGEKEKEIQKKNQ